MATLHIPLSSRLSRQNPEQTSIVIIRFRMLILCRGMGNIAVKAALPYTWLSS